MMKNVIAWPCLLLAASLCTAAPLAQPNIVMLMMDDLDQSVWAQALQLGYLPNIQSEILDKGTVFREAVATLSMCCPSRTTYLTGQYPHNHGVVRNVGPKGGFDSFDNDGSALAVWLRRAGYRTGLIGKYLNGYPMAPGPGGLTYIPPGWDTWNAISTQNMYNYEVSIDGKVVFHGDREEDYQTDVLTGLATKFLHSPDGRPFFLTLTPTAPHYESLQSNDEEAGKTIRPPVRYLDTPQIAPIPAEALASFNEADMSDKPQWMRATPLVDVPQTRTGYSSRVAAIRAVDDMLAAVMAALREIGQQDNTLIIVTSDNGYQFGTHRRPDKTDLYEESIRLPMVIHTPGQLKPRFVDEWVTNVDWAATIVDYAAAKPDILLDGRSLRPWLKATPPATRRKTVLVEVPNDFITHTEHPSYAMIRSKDSSVTGDSEGKAVLVYAETYSKSNTITDKEFYDLTLDPLQLTSLHQSNDPKRLRQMKALASRLAQMKACAGQQCRSLENQSKPQHSAPAALNLR
jgi:N-acetylglucosamine-6-sulfatase